MPEFPRKTSYSRLIYPAAFLTSSNNFSAGNDLHRNAMPPAAMARRSINASAFPVPAFLIPKVELDISLLEDDAMVRATLAVKRNSETSEPTATLQLDVDELGLESINLNGVALAPDQYVLDERHLTISEVPNHFELATVCRSPAGPILSGHRAYLILSDFVGNWNWKIEPLLAPGDTQIRPLWLSIIEWQMESPIPIPSSLVVNSALKIRLMLDGSIPVPLSSIDTCTISGLLCSDFTFNTRGRTDCIASMAFITRFRTTCCN